VVVIGDSLPSHQTYICSSQQKLMVENRKTNSFTPLSSTKHTLLHVLSQRVTRVEIWLVFHPMKGDFSKILQCSIAFKILIQLLDASTLATSTSAKSPFFCNFLKFSLLFDPNH